MGAIERINGNATKEELLEAIGILEKRITNGQYFHGQISVSCEAKIAQCDVPGLSINFTNGMTTATITLKWE